MRPAPGPRYPGPARATQRLGEPYRVVNLAMRAGLTTEAAALAAESLTKDGAPVISSPTSRPDTPGRRSADITSTCSGTRTTSACWRLLIDDPARERRLRELLRDTDAASRTIHDERRLGAALDSAFRFNDLWNSLGYRRVFTFWNFLALNAPFRARQAFPDVDPGPPPLAERYPEARRADFMRGVRGMIDRRRITIGADQRLIVGSGPVPWEEIRRDLETGLPPAVRRRALIVVVRPSSFYVDLLTGEEKLRFAELMRGSVSVLKQAGYEAVAEGDEFTADDFADFLHLGPSGAAKLVDLVAPRIRAMAERLGYVR